MQKLNWSKCQGEIWCKLNFVNLDHQHFNGVEGVYIIWHGGKNPHVVYVGQGKIRDRLRAHRNDAEIQSYAPSGLLSPGPRLVSNSAMGLNAIWPTFGDPRLVHPECAAYRGKLSW